MLFHSGVFLIFFAIVYVLYLMTMRRLRVQNTILLAASYVFYGWWDWRFLALILLSTAMDFWFGAEIGRTTDVGRRKRWVAASVVANLTLLGFFKYFSFFTDSAVRVLHALGFEASPIDLRIVLPVGISFYTFQSMSYAIDIYRGQLKPTRSFLNFALYVTFFPQLVAGPIERASNLLPEVESPRTIRAAQVNAGLFLILWGYYKKLVVADNASAIANTVFNGYQGYSGMDVILGALAFTVQIYCDFSAYSDIARGLAKLMGFELMVNFRLPYFALNPSDFWLRWHISLSSWLRDYLYIPLGGNRGSKLMTERNLFLTMLLGGLWHGASWHFVAWGAYHGVLLAAYRVLDRNPEHLDPWCGKWHPLRILSKMALMFAFTVIGWILFRATSLTQAVQMVGSLGLDTSAETMRFARNLVFYSAPLVFVQVWQYVKGDLLAPLRLPWPLRAAFCAVIMMLIMLFAVREPVEFIYFQF